MISIALKSKSEILAPHWFSRRVSRARFTGERIPTLAQGIDLLTDQAQMTAFVEIEKV